jgi:glycosyltransferase involved in cell wall biosynthesis
MSDSSPRVSVIVCTRNRAAELTRTLEALSGIDVPPDGAELLVVDNASTDDTPQVVRRAELKNMEVRYVCEPAPGLSNARNAGLRNARGEFLLFTDDDVRPAKDWVSRLTLPLQNGRCHAAVGKVVLAPHLQRPWLNGPYIGWLAGMDDSMDDRVELVGANMGFRRSVLEKVPSFDVELGAGALGFGEDTLLSLQFVQAGFRLAFVAEAVVVHHFDPARLRRSAWLDAAFKRGQLNGYLSYHWYHNDSPDARLRWRWYAAKLRLRRVVQRPNPTDLEGCAWWEISYVSNRAKFRQICLERRRPRNYPARGFVKLTPTEVVT